MANGLVAVKLTWDDNSSGALDETGQEIDIWTDSPSFVPNVPINYTEARHPWMRLPPIAAAVEEATIGLKAPVTFVKFRVRQYNARGNGPWTVPQTFPVTQVSGSAVPPSPTNLGMSVTSEAPVPPDLPTEEPPDTTPPPTGGGGSSSNYVFQTQYSGVQGQNQWSYGDSVSPTALVYDAINSKWNGDELYLAVWGSGFRHSSGGTIKDCVVTWTAPANGDVNVVGSFKLFTTPGSVTVKIRHNGVDVFSQNITDATVYLYDETFAVLAGDTVEFVARRLSATVYNNNVELNPTIQLTTGGVPVNPTVGSLSPSVLSIASSGVGSLLVTLSSAPSAAAVVSLSSSDATKATVPASVTVPAGQTSAPVQVTGVAAGSSTITASYNSTSQQSVVTVSNPASGAWANAPAGGTVLFDSALSSLSGLIDDFPPSSTPVTIADAPFSPSMGIRHRLNALATTGGGQVRFANPTSYRELYAGMYWRTNPQFQGRIVPNKMFFLRGSQSNGVICWSGRNPNGNLTGPIVFVVNGGASNQHILGPTSDSGSLFFPNVGNGNVTAGVWYKLEWRMRASTTISSQDGAYQLWINGVLVSSYLNINYSNGTGLNEWVMSQTWDQSGDMGSSNTVAWEHYLDHLIVVGKN